MHSKDFFGEVAQDPKKLKFIKGGKLIHDP